MQVRGGQAGLRELPCALLQARQPQEDSAGDAPQRAVDAAVSSAYDGEAFVPQTMPAGVAFRYDNDKPRCNRIVVPLVETMYYIVSVFGLRSFVIETR